MKQITILLLAWLGSFFLLAGCAKKGKTIFELSEMELSKLAAKKGTLVKFQISWLHPYDSEGKQTGGYLASYIEYDRSGRIIDSVLFFQNDGEISFRSVRKFDNDGRIIERKVHHGLNLGIPLIDTLWNRETFRYDDRGNIMELYVQYNGIDIGTTRYTYDDQNHLIEEMYHDRSRDTSFVVRRASYDNKGNLLKDNFYNFLYNYDKSGRITTMQMVFPAGNMIQHGFSGGYWSSGGDASLNFDTIKTLYRYSKQGVKVEEVVEHSRWTQDVPGNIIKSFWKEEKKFKPDGMPMTERWYDQAGVCFRIINYDALGDVALVISNYGFDTLSKVTTEYLERGNKKVKKVVERRKHHYWVYDEVVISLLWHDSLGSVIEEINFDQGDTSSHAWYVQGKLREKNENDLKGWQTQTISRFDENEKLIEVILKDRRTARINSSTKIYYLWYD